MAEVVRPRDFPPPFNQFAQMTGCDARGENVFPLAVNPENVEAVAFFNSVAGPGDILQIHLVSGQSLYARNTSPAAALAENDPRRNSGIVPPGATEKVGHSYSKADTVAAQDQIPVPRSEADSYDR